MDINTQTDEVIELDDDDNDDGVLVMNFWEEGEDFPQPNQIKEEVDAEAEFQGNIQSSESCESLIKEENSSYVIDMREHFYANQSPMVQSPKEEYILGTEETPDIIAIARNASDDDADENDAESEKDEVEQAGEAPDVDNRGKENEPTKNASEDDTDENNAESEKDEVEQAGEAPDEDNRGKENEPTKAQTTLDPNVITLDSDSEDDITISDSKNTEKITTQISKTSAAKHETNDTNLNVVPKSKIEELPLKQVESNYTFKCDICSFSTKTRFSLSRHKELHAGSIKQNLTPTSTPSVEEGPKKASIKIFKCRYCSFASKIRFALKRHTMEHHRVFKNNDIAVVDINQPNSERSGGVKCIYCSYTALTPLGLTVHVGIEHKTKIPPEIKNYKISRKKGRPALPKIVQQCSYCSYKTTVKASLKIHMLLHTKYNRPIYKCVQCDFHSNKYSMGRHMKAVHKKADVKKKTDAEKELDVPKKPINKDEKHVQDKNMKIESNGLVYVCEVCDFVTNMKETLIVHKRSHSNNVSEKDTEKSLKLTDEEIRQNSTSKYFYDIRKKQGIILDDNSRQCVTCNQIFGGLVAFTFHRCTYAIEFLKLVSFKDSIYSCKQCSYSTSNKYRMKTHLESHKKINSYKIHLKQKVVRNIQKVKHGLNKKNKTRYECDQCDFKTKHHRVIIDHRTICPEKQFTCEICGFVTVSSIAIKSHKIYKHESDDGLVKETSINNKYKCDACDFQTDYEPNLLNHKVVHISINELTVYKNKTYNVNINQKDTVKGPENQATKTENNLYKCNECLYKTTEQRYLLMHTKYAHSKKLHNIYYTCQHCYYKSNTNSELNKHFKNKHPGTRKKILFGCTICSFTTKFKQSLDRHMQTRHIGLQPLKDGTESGFSMNVVKRKPNLFNCTSCFYVTKYKGNLDTHFNKCHVKK